TTFSIRKLRRGCLLPRRRLARAERTDFRCCYTRERSLLSFGLIAQPRSRQCDGRSSDRSSLTMLSRNRKRREIFRSHSWRASENLAGRFADSINALCRTTLKKPERVVSLAGFETAHGRAVGVAQGV